jgi:hypothetical protein
VRLLSLACLMLASSVFGHPAQPGPEDPVITVNGFCAGGGRQGDACQTIVTRAQFEQLTEALQPGMPPELRLKVANAYAQMMRMAAAAEQRGLDKTTAFDEEMRYARLQLLSQDLSRALRKEAAGVTEAEVEAYYENSRVSFEQATLARIFIPRTGRRARGRPDSAGTVPSEAPGADEEAMQKVAAELRARAVRGEDPDKLQSEAYTAAGIPGTAPETRMVAVRRGTLPPTHEVALDLQPGEVSEVLSDPGGGHFVYKMVSRETLSLQDATGEIRKRLADQRYREAMQAFSGDVVYNDAYFANTAAAAPATGANPHRRPHRPPTP